MSRTLDSFADEIITKVSRAQNGLWYATLDVGPRWFVSDPDFSTCAVTKEAAIAKCAAKIRADARGEGKYAPHDLLLPGYSLHYRLMPYWAEKEER